MTRGLTDKFNNAINKADKSLVKRNFQRSEEFIEWRKKISKEYTLKDEIKYDIVKRLSIDKSNLNIAVTGDVKKTNKSLNELYSLLVLKEVMAFFHYGKNYSNLSISVSPKGTSMEGYILLNSDDSRILSLVQKSLRSIKKKMKNKFKLVFEEYTNEKHNESFLTIGFRVKFPETVKVAKKNSFKGVLFEGF